MTIILRRWSSILNRYVESELPTDIIEEGTYADFPISDIGFMNNDLDHQDHINYIRIYKE